LYDLGKLGVTIVSSSFLHCFCIIFSYLVMSVAFDNFFSVSVDHWQCIIYVHVEK